MHYHKSNNLLSCTAQNWHNKYVGNIQYKNPIDATFKVYFSRLEWD